MTEALSLRNISVLVVDDNLFMRRILTTILRGLGVVQIHEAADGVEALEMMRQYYPDIVILDWEMPILNGADVMREIRHPDHDLAFQTVIMLTAFSERSRVLEACYLGVNAFLCKPVSARTLYDRIHDCIVHPRPFLKNDRYFGPEPVNGIKPGREKPAAGEKQARMAVAESEIVDLDDLEPMSQAV